jgi:hypothetical protein
MTVNTEIDQDKLDALLGKMVEDIGATISAPGCTGRWPRAGRKRRTSSPSGPGRTRATSGRGW